MTELYIFSQDDKPLTIITEDTGLVSAPVRIEVNSVPDTPFSFTVEADSPNAQYVKDENKVVYRDHEGDLRLVVIKELDDSDGIDGPLTTAICEPEFMELAETFVLDRRFTDKTAQFALDAALENTGWIGEVEVDLGLASTNFYRTRVVDAIMDIIKTWGGEFKDVVEFDDKNNIISRKIRIIQRLGKDHGQRFEIDHNITEIGRTILSYPKTAMYGWGASLETEGGGHSRYIDFGDVVWKKGVNGAPVDKPKGQMWVGDPEAFEKYKRFRGGKWIHRFGEFSNQDYEDPEKLLWATWQNLQENKYPEVNYRLSVDLFNDKVSLGDTAIAIDRYFSRPIEIQARVIAMEYDLLDIDGTMVVEMGQFLDLDDDRLDEVINEVEKIKSRPSKVTESSYPDKKPSRPVNLRAEGGIEVIQLYWDYADEIYIKHYEVYGSQVKDFVPDSQHLLWRGQVSAFAHTVGTDQVWYYRVRAVNYHGTASDWSAQVEASTHRVISDDILFGEDIAEKLRELSEVADLLADDSVSWDKISEEAKKLIDQQAKKYTDAEIQATENRLLADIADKADLAYVDGKLQLKADANTVSAVQRDIDDLESKANDLRANVTNIVTDLSDLRTSVNNDIAGLNNTADNLLKRVSENEDALKANGGKITSIEQEVDTVKGSLSTTIEQLSSIDGVVKSQSTQISANTKAIGLKASQSSVNELTGKISTVEGSIETLAGKVSLKAEAKDVYTKSEVNTALGKKVDTTTYSKKISQLDVSIDGINASVSSIQSNVSDVDSRLEKAQAQLNVLPGQINAKAEKSSVYTKTETDGRISSQINSAKAEIKITTDGISQEVSKVDSKINGLEIGGRNLLRYTDFSKKAHTDRWIEIDNSRFIEPRKFDGFPRYFGYIPIASSPVGYRPRFRSAYNVSLVNGQTYTVSWVGATSDFVNSDFNWSGILGNNGLFTHQFVGGLDRKKIGEATILGYTKPIYKYKTTFTYKGETAENLALMIGSTVTRESAPWMAVTDIQLEHGNMANDWNLAPEDIDFSIGEVSQYASRIDQKADNIQTSVSSLQSTVDSHGSKITSAETKIDQNTTAIGQRATKTELTTALKGKVDTSTYNSKVGELTTSIDGIRQSVSEVRVDFDSLEIGGRNLLRYTDFSKKQNTDRWTDVGAVKFIRPQKFDGYPRYFGYSSVDAVEEGYRVRLRTPYNVAFVNGREYTLSWLGITSDWVSASFDYTGILKSDGYFVDNRSLPNPTRKKVGEVDAFGYKKSVYKYSITFKFTADTAENYSIMIGSTVNRASAPWMAITDVMLEFGNVAGDWGLAPEDTASLIEENKASIDTLAGRIDLKAESTTVQGLTKRVTKAEQEINALDGQIRLKVDDTRYKADLDGIVKQLSQQSSQIELNKSSINLMARKSYVDDITNSISNDLAKLDVKAETIQSKVESIQIGGRNLLRSTDFSKQENINKLGTPSPIDNVQKSNPLGGFEHIDFVYFGASNPLVGDKIRTTLLGSKFKIIEGETYTLSFIGITSSYINTDFDYTLILRNGVGFRIDSQQYSKILIGQAINGSYTYDVYQYQMTFVASWSDDNAYPMIGSTVNTAKSTWFRLANIQLERGNYRTDWQPSIEDTDQRMTKSESIIAQLSDDILLKVNKDDLISEINLRPDGIRIKGSLIEIDGLTLIREGAIGTAAIANASITRAKLGTAIVGTAQIDDLAVTSAKIASVNADKINAANLAAISADLGTVRAGRLLSNNSNMDLNLNTGALTMKNADFTLGGGANIRFNNAGNRIHYSHFGDGLTRTSGFGVGTSINDQYPYVFMGTTGTSGNNFDPKDANYFTGFIANTNKRMSVDGIGNSVVGNVFHIRDKSVSFERGFSFDLSQVRKSIRPMNTGTYTYDLGAEDAHFSRAYINDIRSDNGFIRFRNSSTPYASQGFTMETSYGDDSQMAFRGTTQGDYWNLGKPGWRFSYVYLKYQPDVSSDERLKENIKSNTLGLDFINDIDTKSFNLINNNTRIKKEPLQFGVIAQHLRDTLIKHDVDVENINMLSKGSDGMYGVQYNQLIAPTIKAVQELDTKVDDEISWLKTENQLLKNEVSILENKIKILEEKVA